MSDSPQVARLRKIIHIDMDAFYASVEQRDFEHYRGKPVVVGGSPDGRGVVAACNYEARKFGIHSAMPAAQARRLCPHAVFIRPRFEVYRGVSRQIREIFHVYTPLVEPLSLDEAYLDVTHTQAFDGSATRLAKDIKREIRAGTDLTASAGVSYNKFLAKIASDMDKPDGLFVITPAEGPEFVERLPIGRFHGIGKATESRMKGLGVHTGADLKAIPLYRLQRLFGKQSAYYYEVARGIDDRPVVTRRKRKSLSSEKTFEQDIGDISTMLVHLQALAEQVSSDLQGKRLAGRTLSIKVKYDNFEQITRSRTFNTPVHCIEELSLQLPELLRKTEAGRRKVRLLGVCVSNIQAMEGGEIRQQQLSLF
ncbi:MAG: DNA polymerase IV [Pseudomonadota bacterium]